MSKYYKARVHLMQVLLALGALLITFMYSLTVEAEPLLNQWAWSQWDNKGIAGATRYEPVTDLDKGIVIKAESNDSASRLVLDKSIQLEATPVLSWSWLAAEKPKQLSKDELGIESIDENFDEITLDDYVARIQVGRSDGALSFSQKRLTYIWSSQEYAGKEWAINEHEHAIVVTGKEAMLETWYNMKRNLQDDWKRIFDEDISSFDSLAIMTDSDGTGSVAKAYYGPISTQPH